MFTSDEAVKIFELVEKENTKKWYEVIPIEREYVHKINPSQVVISDVKKIEKNKINVIFPHKKEISVSYCQAKPNLSCPVCFDHPLDHYPLMMLLEIGRQLAIAASHKIFIKKQCIFFTFRKKFFVHMQVGQ